MNAEEFGYIVEHQLQTCNDMLMAKADEYATDFDRLSNFKTAAVLQSITPAQALRGMMAKHTVSIYDMLNTGESYSAAMWTEKITDHINYLLLLRAIVTENLVNDTTIINPISKTGSLKNA